MHGVAVGASWVRTDGVVALLLEDHGALGLAGEKGGVVVGRLDDQSSCLREPGCEVAALGSEVGGQQAIRSRSQGDEQDGRREILRVLGSQPVEQPRVDRGHPHDACVPVGSVPDVGV